MRYVTGGLCLVFLLLLLYLLFRIWLKAAGNGSLPGRSPVIRFRKNCGKMHCALSDE